VNPPPTTRVRGARGEFRHDALLYAGVDDFVAGALAFVREGLAVDDPTLVMVSAAKIRLLRAALGRDADRIEFADMELIGRNPARIIPSWQEFSHQHTDRAIRGIGEPVWAEREPAELVEAQHHETLLNLAFADRQGLWLLCPYDRDALAPEVIAEAERSHPYLSDGAQRRHSGEFARHSAPIGLSCEPLPEPEGHVTVVTFDMGALGRVRSLVVSAATMAGLDERRASDLAIAVNEATSNSVRHGGGIGTLRIWSEPDRIWCEVQDAGRLAEPMLGRTRPTREQVGGRGLWLANQLCDLVQLRASDSGSVVRMQMRFSKSAPPGPS
jgi:anti-sigma regulatory factor (Ser/Thr protein kinase)